MFFSSKPCNALEGCVHLFTESHFPLQLNLSENATLQIRNPSERNPLLYSTSETKWALAPLSTKILTRKDKKQHQD